MVLQNSAVKKGWRRTYQVSRALARDGNSVHQPHRVGALWQDLWFGHGEEGCVLQEFLGSTSLTWLSNSHQTVTDSGDLQLPNEKCFQMTERTQNSVPKTNSSYSRSIEIRMKSKILSETGLCSQILSHWQDRVYFWCKQIAAHTSHGFRNKHFGLIDSLEAPSSPPK